MTPVTQLSSESQENEPMAELHQGAMASDRDRTLVITGFYAHIVLLWRAPGESSMALLRARRARISWPLSTLRWDSQ
jgi:hypothetical protein